MDLKQRAAEARRRKNDRRTDRYQALIAQGVPADQATEARHFSLARIKRELGIDLSEKEG